MRALQCQPLSHTFASIYLGRLFAKVEVKWFVKVMAWKSNVRLGHTLLGASESTKKAYSFHFFRKTR